jgi:hypothetical protein
MDLDCGAKFYARQVSYSMLAEIIAATKKPGNDPAFVFMALKSDDRRNLTALF